MKKLSKIVSVVLSLALCLGMAAPAFAASFDDLQNAINSELPSAAEPAPEVPDEPEPPAEPVQKTEDGSLILGTDNHYGFGWNPTDNRFGIEAWDDAETGRNVQLNEGVEHNRSDKVETITVDDKVNLDLNENTIKGQTTWKPIITVSGEDASLTLDGDGTISGAAQASDSNKITHGLSVKDGASLTMKNGTLTDFNNAVVVEGGSTFTMEDGKITNNSGAGVRVKGAGSSFTMENGTISENNRGSVRVTEGAFFEMKDGTITKNSANGEHGGGSVYVEKSTFEMSGGSITDSLTGGIIGNNSTIKLVAADPDKPIEISNNKGIGVQTYGGSTLTMDGVSIRGNSAGRGSGINTSGDKEVTLKNVTLEGNKGGDSVLFSWKTENVKIENSTIKDNESSLNTVWICYNTAEISNSDIDGNGANAIAAEYWSKLTVNGKTLYGSYADKVGSDGTISGLKNNGTYGATILVLDEDGNTVTEIKLPQGGNVDKDGNITGNLIISKTFNENETTHVTIISKDREDKFTIPTDKQADVKLDKDGVLTGLPENSVVITTGAEGRITETKLLNGGGIDANGNFTGDFVISKTDNSDNTTTAAVTANGHVSTIIVPTNNKDSVELGEDGNTTIPEGCVVIKEDGSEIDLPHGGLFNADGTYTVNPHTYTNQVTKPATCTEAGERADICTCGDKKNVESIPVLAHTEEIDAAKAATCTETGLTEGKHCSVCGEVITAQEVVPVADHTIVVDERVEPTETSTGLTEGSHCGVCGEVIVAQEEIPMLTPTTPVFPVVPDDGTGADVAPDEDTTTLEDQEVPLAGLMPVAQLLEELRRYEKIEDAELPEDFQWLDHEYAQAIYWGLQEELVVDTEEEPFDPDEVVTVALLRNVLTNFVELYKGLDDFVAALEGEDDELVMDLGERLTVFYAELEACLENQEDKAA